MGNATFNRRELLRATGCGLAGFAALSSTAVASDDPESNAESKPLVSAEGDGSADDPYVITDATELQGIASEPDAHYELGDDVDASDVGGSGGFEPIEAFAGHLDGNGYEITGLTIDRPEENDVGLFADTEASATIERVRLVDVEIVGNNTTAGLAGSNAGTIERSFVSGTVESESGSSFADVGGLVAENNGTITESFSTADVTAEEAGRVGGFVGRNRETIEDAYATGDVVGDDDVGGFVGNNSGTIETSYATGIVGGPDVGGFAGSSDTEVDCYWDEEASGLAFTAGDATGLSTDEMQGADGTDNLTGFDFDSTWETVAGEYPVLAAIDDADQLAVRPDERRAALPTLEGDGSAEDPYVVTAVDHLQAMATDRIAFYELEADVEAGGGFEPIEAFAGHLDGNGYEITGLTIDRPEENDVGLFADTVMSATIERVRLVDVEVVGNSTTAGLVGSNGGTIERSFVSGTVESESGSSFADVGGLIARNNGTITESFSTADVTAEEAGRVGGFVGRNRETIEDAYATGDVVGDDDVGGFVGNNSGTIETSYATGIVGGPDVGGFAGNSDTEVDCYWDEAASGLAFTAGDATGRTTDEMQGEDAESLLAGFDFDSAWETVAGEYPVLAAIDDADQLAVRPDERRAALPTLEGDGSAEDPYVVTAVDHLQAMATDRIAFYELEADVEAGDGFEPVEAFAGHLDGNGHEITGLTIDRPEENDVGLFADTVMSATIERVRLVDVEIVGNSTTAGLAGSNAGTIERSFVSGTVESESGSSFADVGGLIARNNGTITESFSTADVTAEEAGRVGGFVGRNRETIEDAYAMGDVVGDDDVGGFVGNNSGTIETSYSIGTVEGDDIGGFAGSSDTEEDCYWDEEASGLESTAGDATGLSTDQMQGDSVYFHLEFDFDDVWRVVDDPDDYPELAWEPEGDDDDDDESALEQYAGEDDVVETDGLRKAINDWRGGVIDTDLLRDVIDHWRSGEPVV
ncbi:GLUG motif-containing protein [Natronobeatus ordinarius]|uniref:GLUG motif-containing protein n=1 Tax=Natronobeatus ordinarius TaxID=2963433 RepID=UPI0020CBC59A|nr:GLUG motif-containing protein [Natronobeatus ordinarius]